MSEDMVRDESGIWPSESDSEAVAALVRAIANMADTEDGVRRGVWAALVRHMAAYSRHPDSTKGHTWWGSLASRLGRHNDQLTKIIQALADEDGR